MRVADTAIMSADNYSLHFQTHPSVTNEQRAEAEALFTQGTRHMETGDAVTAEACFRKALQLVPDFAEAYANLGLLLDRQKNIKEAEVCYRRSIELNSTYSRTHLNLGALLANQKRFAEAEAAYTQCIALDPESPLGWSNMGVLYACMKREAEAEECYRIAISLDETYPTARFNLSYLLLRQGRFEEGWECLESRDWYTVLSGLPFPRWQGGSLLGRRILITHEAGHGDVIQFCRYASLLKAQGAATIGMICAPSLKALLETLDGLDTIISFDEKIPESGWDFWTPLLSIPYHCKTRLDSIPATLPYLHAPADRIEKWGVLMPQKGLRVGLVWKGNPHFENDVDRSLASLDVLAPLGSVAGATFISLQKGEGEDEAAQPPAGLNIINLGSQLTDFADTAAVIMNLDLVICVDTAIGHLAGALGKPCWVLLPEYKTDWRWLTERSDSPWYPQTMRLFRQQKMGDWEPVIREVVQALEQLA